MAFEFDTGGEGSSQGPWIQWAAQKEKFLLRDKEGKTDFNTFKEGGVVLDIHSMKTVWSRSDGIAGVAPEWKWNHSVSVFSPKPGDDWKKGFQITCAIGGGEVATWEQAGVGAWNAFVALVPAIQAGPADTNQLPLVKLTGVRPERFAKTATNTPVLEIVKWVPRPDCLKEGVAAGIATEEPAPQPTAKPAPVASDASEF